MITILSINCAQLSIENVAIVASRQGINVRNYFTQTYISIAAGKKSNLSRGQSDFKTSTRIFTMSFAHIGRVYSASSSGLCQLPGALWTRVGAASRQRKGKRGPPCSLVRELVRETPTLLSFGIGSTFLPLYLFLSFSFSLSFIFSTVPHAYGSRHQHSLLQGRPYLPFLSATLDDIKPRVPSREIHLQGRNSRGITRNISSFHIA